MAGMEIFFVILIIIGILVYNKTIDFKRFMIDNSQVFDLLKEGVSPAHVVKSCEKRLEDAGFEKIAYEKDNQSLEGDERI